MERSDEHGIVILGDVSRSRRAPSAAGEWLHRLTRELDDAYGVDRLAPFAFTQGDELQGLLRPSADPLRAVLHAGLADGRLEMRWAVAAGAVAPGRGRATERSGEAYFRARDLIDAAARGRDGLVMHTGAAAPDALLADLAPLLAELLAGLSARQREVARLALIEGLRQADVAERLGVSRATISVTWARSRVRSIERLARALRTIFADGVARDEAAAASAEADDRADGSAGHADEVVDGGDDGASEGAGA